MIDIVDPTSDYSMADFKELADKEIEDIINAKVELINMRARKEINIRVIYSYLKYQKKLTPIRFLMNLIL